MKSMQQIVDLTDLQYPKILQLKLWAQVGIRIRKRIRKIE